MPMSDTIIPKEQQSAYQRWEMASFGDSRPSARAESAAQATRVSIEEQAEIREAAQERGYAIGLAEGRSEGLRQGLADAAAETAHLRSIVTALGSEVSRADELIAGDVLILALDLAKAMLKTSLTARPELVLPIVSEAIRYLPVLQQPAVLFLHPDDVMVVNEHMRDELNKAGWRVAEDMHMVRGGCRIDTASNQIDATIETRWHRLAEALGQNSAWLEE
jgi:flagellar assembly protein FliH